MVGWAYYLVDTLIGKWPQFHDVKNLLEYMNDGEKGMLDYANFLENSDVNLTIRHVIDQSRNEIETTSLMESIEVSRF